MRGKRIWFCKAASAQQGLAVVHGGRCVVYIRSSGAGRMKNVTLLWVHVHGITNTGLKCTTSDWLDSVQSKYGEQYL